mgnify:CR=1 FL=1
MKTSRSRSPILVLVAFTAVALAGCTLEGITNAFSGGDCDAFSTTYDEEFVKAGLLSTAIPDTVDGFAMGARRHPDPRYPASGAPGGKMGSGRWRQNVKE